MTRLSSKNLEHLTSADVVIAATALAAEYRRIANAFETVAGSMASSLAIGKPPAKADLERLNEITSEDFLAGIAGEDDGDDEAPITLLRHFAGCGAEILLGELILVDGDLITPAEAADRLRGVVPAELAKR